VRQQASTRRGKQESGKAIIGRKKGTRNQEDCQTDPERGKTHKEPRGQERVSEEERHCIDVYKVRHVEVCEVAIRMEPGLRHHESAGHELMFVMIDRSRKRVREGNQEKVRQKEYGKRSV
jgi:hypothetical protein